MTTSHMSDPDDQPVTHRLIDAFWVAPTPPGRHRTARRSRTAGLPARIRRGAARLITRL